MIDFLDRRWPARTMLVGIGKTTGSTVKICEAMRGNLFLMLNWPLVNNLVVFCVTNQAIGLVLVPPRRGQRRDWFVLIGTTMPVVKGVIVDSLMRASSVVVATQRLVADS